MARLNLRAVSCTVRLWWLAVAGEVEHRDSERMAAGIQLNLWQRVTISLYASATEPQLLAYKQPPNSTRDGSARLGQVQSIRGNNRTARLSMWCPLVKGNQTNFLFRLKSAIFSVIYLSNNHNQWNDEPRNHRGPWEPFSVEASASAEPLVILWWWEWWWQWRPFWCCCSCPSSSHTFSHLLPF